MLEAYGGLAVYDSGAIAGRTIDPLRWTVGESGTVELQSSLLILQVSPALALNAGGGDPGAVEPAEGTAAVGEIRHRADDYQDADAAHGTQQELADRHESSGGSGVTHTLSLFAVVAILRSVDGSTMIGERVGRCRISAHRTSMRRGPGVLRVFADE
jgi:hypothetical protein